MVSCTGWRSKKPPIHLNPNLDFQPKNTPQSDSLERPANVVPWGNEESFVTPEEREQYLKEDTEVYIGKTKENCNLCRCRVMVKPNKRNGAPNKRNGAPNKRNALPWHGQ